MKIIRIAHEYHKKHNGNKSDDFRLGFLSCMNIFEIGLKREGLVNQGMLMDENENLRNQIQKLNQRIENQIKDIKNKELVISRLREEVSDLQKVISSTGTPAGLTKGEGALRKHRMFISVKGLHKEFSLFCNSLK